MHNHVLQLITLSAQGITSRNGASIANLPQHYFSAHR